MRHARARRMRCPALTPAIAAPRKDVLLAKRPASNDQEHRRGLADVAQSIHTSPSAVPWCAGETSAKRSRRRPRTTISPDQAGNRLHQLLVAGRGRNQPMEVPQPPCEDGVNTIRPPKRSVSAQRKAGERPRRDGHRDRERGLRGRQSELFAERANALINPRIMKTIANEIVRRAREVSSVGALARPHPYHQLIQIGSFRRSTQMFLNHSNSNQRSAALYATGVLQSQPAQAGMCIRMLFEGHKNTSSVFSHKYTR